MAETVMSVQIAGQVAAYFALFATLGRAVFLLHFARCKVDEVWKNKYYSLGADPIAAIVALGFTQPLTGFARGGFRHELLASQIWCPSSQEGWTACYAGCVTSIDSLATLEKYVRNVALDELRKRSANLGIVTISSVVPNVALDELRKPGAK